MRRIYRRIPCGGVVAHIICGRKLRFDLPGSRMANWVLRPDACSSLRSRFEMAWTSIWPVCCEARYPDASRLSPPGASGAPTQEEPAGGHGMVPRLPSPTAIDHRRPRLLGCLLSSIATSACGRHGTRDRDWTETVSLRSPADRVGRNCAAPARLLIPETRLPRRSESLLLIRHVTPLLPQSHWSPRDAVVFARRAQRVCNRERRVAARCWFRPSPRSGEGPEWQTWTAILDDDALCPPSVSSPAALARPPASTSPLRYMGWHGAEQVKRRLVRQLRRQDITRSGWAATVSQQYEPRVAGMQAAWRPPRVVGRTQMKESPQHRPPHLRRRVSGA